MQSSEIQYDIFDYDEVVTVCAWCRRARIVTDDFRVVWSEKYSIGRHQALSHTICPACKKQMMAQNAQLAVAG